MAMVGRHPLAAVFIPIAGLIWGIVIMTRGQTGSGLAVVVTSVVATAVYAALLSAL